MRETRNSGQSTKTRSTSLLSLNLKPHTVILTCGPSGVGKSHLLSLVSKKLADFNSLEKNTLKLKYSVLSSDQNRYRLLQENQDSLGKFAPSMLHVSKQAFALLEEELANLISYPVNQHFVFVDTTGLTKSWREKIVAMCKAKHYNVDLMLFSFDDRKEFFTHTTNKFITEKGIKRLYEDVIPNLERHAYNNVIKVARSYSDDDIELSSLVSSEEYADLARVETKRLELQSAAACYVVGDVHGCFNTLKTFLEEVFNTSIVDENTIMLPDIDKNAEDFLTKKVVLAGDIIDKGIFGKETIKFCLNNRHLISWTIGNHENFIKRCLDAPTSGSKGVPQEVLDDYFTSLNQYGSDEEFKELLQQFVSESYPFIRTDTFIVTHAPCREEFLGKVDRVAKKEQRNISLLHADTKENAEKILGFLVKEAEVNYPYHFFGHVATQKTFRIKNKISLDSAAVCGTGLTAYKVSPTLNKKLEKSVTSTHPADLKGSIFHKAPSYFTLFDEDKVDYNALEGKVKNRIDWLCKNKVNYISGTMSPSSQQYGEGDSIVSIESLQAGLDYYAKKGITSVLMQPKYMGSRCNVYLGPKISDCYMTSRNGYVINKLHKEKGTITNLRAFFKKIRNLPEVQAIYTKNPGLEFLILDGELLPWYALGKGLVEDTYKPIAGSVSSELDSLQAEGFHTAVQDKLSELQSALDAEGSLRELGKSNHRLAKTFEVMQKLDAEGSLVVCKDQLVSLKAALRKFDYQVKLFGKAGNLDFKPFAILKMVFEDGREILPDYVQSFKDISSDTFMEVDLTSPAGYHTAHAFQNICAKEEMEGIVLKPILSSVTEITTKQIAPYLKVRNSEYLRLVYGYDYLDNKKKYERLARKKDNRNKIKVSISEFNIGLKLLQTPYADINNSNQKYKEILATMINEEAKERSLDPRL